jgi:predicted ATPase
VPRDIPKSIEKYALKILHQNREIKELLGLLNDKEKIKKYYGQYPQDVDDAIHLLTQASGHINKAVGRLMGFGPLEM